MARPNSSFVCKWDGRREPTVDCKKILDFVMNKQIILCWTNLFTDVCAILSMKTIIHYRFILRFIKNNYTLQIHSREIKGVSSEKTILYPSIHSHCASNAFIWATRSVNLVEKSSTLILLFFPFTSFCCFCSPSIYSIWFVLHWFLPRFGCKIYP
jgi:hypothetical protein